MREVQLRWNRADRIARDNAGARLIFMTMELCLDRLRSQAGETNVLPPFSARPGSGPLTACRITEQADDLAVVFLRSLDGLTPEKRVAYLLRVAFHASHAELAQMTGKSDAECRRLVRSACVLLGKKRPSRPIVKVSASDAQFRVLRKFAAALASGDYAALKSLLAPHARLAGDGSGKIPRFRNAPQGRDLIAQCFAADSIRYGDAIRMELAMTNGQWTLLCFVDDVLESTLSCDTAHERIVAIYVARNPPIRHAD